MSDYTVLEREQAADFMAKYPGFGEMRSYTDGLDCEQVALTWRQMPPGTGGKGSYGHRHKTQEELYLVVRGKIQVKVEDDVFEAGPQTAVRIAPHALRSIHNDGPDEAEVVLVSVKLDSLEGEVETVPDFWPED
jgi:mannose-6-phosphate isomerase-like protein (cupin superfamily)